MFLQVSNRAQTQLAQGINASQTTLVVEDGSNFPQSNFVITIENERILVGHRNGNYFYNLTRGYDNTQAIAHQQGVAVELRIIAKHITELQNAVNVLDLRMSDVEKDARRFSRVIREAVATGWQNILGHIGMEYLYLGNTDSVMSEQEPIQRFMTDSASGSYAGIMFYPYFRKSFGGGIILNARIKFLAPVSDIRCWFGLFTNNPYNCKRDEKMGVIAFGYDTEKDNTNYWRIATSDNDNNWYVYETSVEVAENTYYDLMIRVDSINENVDFYINQNLAGSSNTYLPDNYINLQIYLVITTLDNNTKTFDFMRCWVVY